MSEQDKERAVREVIQTKDASLVLRIPRDGFDVTALKMTEENKVKGNQTLLTEKSKVLQEALQAADIQELPYQESITYLDSRRASGYFSEELKYIGERLDIEVGIAITPPKKRGKKTFSDILVYCEIDGVKFRILSIDERSPLYKSPDEPQKLTELKNEINKIFVPSKMIMIGRRIYLLMPIIEKMEHPKKIAPEELDDFVSRLQSSRVTPQVDLGMTEEEAAESNLALVDGRIYISDAGDLLNGEWDSGSQDEVIEEYRDILSKRISNTT